MTRVIDSHAHYDHKRYNADRNALLQAMPDLGVGMIINVGSNLLSSQASVKLAQTYSYVYATVGVHPHDAKTLTDADLEKIRQLALSEHKKVVAVGEIGLDFHYDFSPRDVQRSWFIRQLRLAHELNMPVVIHSREAHEEVFDIISRSAVRTGVLHSFSGDAKLAAAYVEMGFNIGISGVVTFDKTGTLQKVVAEIPLEKILLETDAPYLTPAPFRGKRNESQYLTYVAQEIAKIKNVDVKTVCEQTSENVKLLFNI